MFYCVVFTKENTYQIFNNWEFVKNRIVGIPVKHKKFNEKKSAEEWGEQNLEELSKKLPKNKILPKKKTRVLSIIDKDVIYCDSGTGGGKGVQIRVTNWKRESILNLQFSSKHINKKGNIELNQFIKIEEPTNNLGELMALHAALKIASKTGCKKIASDSKLVIEFWSRGVIKTTKEFTRNQIEKVVELREGFERNGGEIFKISGDINPADLGYHR